MKGWVGQVVWPCSGRFTHISDHSSAAGRAQDRESSPVTDRRSTTVPGNQPATPGQLNLLPSAGWQIVSAKCCLAGNVTVSHWHTSKISDRSIYEFIGQRVRRLRYSMGMVLCCQRNRKLNLDFREMQFPFRYRPVFTKCWVWIRSVVGSTLVVSETVALNRPEFDRTQ